MDLATRFFHAAMCITESPLKMHLTLYHQRMLSKRQTTMPLPVDRRFLVGGASLLVLFLLWITRSPSVSSLISIAGYTESKNLAEIRNETLGVRD